MNWKRRAEEERHQLRGARERDANYHQDPLPEGWIAQRDRRFLLGEIDRLTAKPVRRVDADGVIWEGSTWCGYIDNGIKKAVLTMFYLWYPRKDAR